MAATAGSLFKLHESRIEEVINQNIDVILPGLDPIWQGTLVSSQGVGPADAIGRDMQVIRVFQGGMTGVLEQARPRDDFVLYGDQTTKYGTRQHLQRLTQTFPDATEGPNQSPYRFALPMRAMVANIMFTLGELTAEAQPAFIGQILAPKLEGFSRNISHTLCNYAYLSQNTNFQLCTVDELGTPEADGNGNWFVTFQPANEACDRFYPGQRLDFYNSAGTFRLNDTVQSFASQTTSTRIKVFVDYVDELTNTVRIVSEGFMGIGDTSSSSSAGSSGEDKVWAWQLVDGAIVVYANSAHSDSGAKFSGIAGLNSYIKTGGESNTNILGAESVSGDAIDVAVYPEHKSLSYDFGGAAMTEHVLRQLLRRFHAAKNKYGYYVDTVIASDGVWLGYEATRIGREWVDRTNRVASTTSQGLASDSNFGGFQFVMDGRTYKGMTSTYVDDGVVYGIRTGGGNWKRYVPRDIRNTRNFDRAPSFIPFRFVASALTGLGSNQLPMYDSSGSNVLVTEGSQMPGWLRMQLCPDQFCGMRFTTVGTDKIYSDESATGI
jgi:hypothetical protein